MNVITFAGEAENTAERICKSCEIYVAGGDCLIEYAGGGLGFGCGEVAVVPAFFKHGFSGTGIRLSLDKALLPFKDIKIIGDVSGGIAFAAKQAQRFLGGENAVIESLGGLIAAYVIAFSGGEKLSPAVAAVRDEIKRKASDPGFSLEDSLRKLPLSYDYVRKLFKKETGATPHEYLIHCRMKLAREIIDSGIGNRYSNYSVAQIAEACGFSEPLYFSRVFKKYYGCAPSLLIGK